MEACELKGFYYAVGCPKRRSLLSSLFTRGLICQFRANWRVSSGSLLLLQDKSAYKWSL